MRLRAIGTCALAAAVLGVAGCSSGAGGGGLPGGIAGSSCKILWADLNAFTRTFATQSAAASWANQNDSENSNVEPVYQFRVSASQTVTVDGVTVVFYNGSGTEISSTSVNVGQALTAGQGYTYDPVAHWGSDSAPDGSETCQIADWD